MLEVATMPVKTQNSATTPTIPYLDNLPDIAFLRLPEVLKVYPVSKPTWYRGIASGKYPKPVVISANCVAWRVGDIKKLLEQTK